MEKFGATRKCDRKIRRSGKLGMTGKCDGKIQHSGKLGAAANNNGKPSATKISVQQ